LRILFVHNHPTKFVNIDIELLRRRYQVDEWYQKSRVINVPKLGRAIAHCDLVFGWFASWHTLFPAWMARTLKRPLVLVVGGYDTANLREIEYGSQRKGIKKFVALAAMNSATRIIVNSYAAREETIRNTGIHTDRITVIYHGIEATKFSGTTPKEKLVITVAHVNKSNLLRKGLEPFVRTASLIPECNFVMIGVWRDGAIRHLKALAPPNVQFTGWVTEDQLGNYLSRAAVYVQASRHEGFGLAVAEAMLHKCVPVVTRVGALPEVVDECGVYIDTPEPREIADGIRRAMTQAKTLGPCARERIMSQFTLGRRGELLYQTIDAIVEQDG
jgi:glycosyltransferase involved in cell wall biosynthesis